MTRPAHEVYEIRWETAPLWRRLPRLVAVFVANVVTLGSGPSNPGGGTGRILERDTGREVGTVVEGFGDEAQATASAVTTDLETLTAEEFARTWLSDRRDDPDPPRPV